MSEEDPTAESDIGGDHADTEHSDVHERAMQRFDSVAPSQVELRAQSLLARRFTTIPGAQWEGWYNQDAEGIPRPEVDMVYRGLRKIYTDYTQNRLTVDFKPAGDSGDSDTADMLDGLYRADLANFKGQQAIDNAFSEAISGGFGAWRLTEDYVDPYDKDDDSLRINPAYIIPDADQRVYFDPACPLYDKSSAMWAFVIHKEPRLAFDRKWGAGNAVDWPLTTWSWSWDWYTIETVQSAEYYEVEEKDEDVLIFTNDITDEEQRYFRSELQEGQQSDMKAQGWKVRTRKVKRRRVHKYIMNGSRVLEDCGFISGDQIPVVPVYGIRSFVDGMERWEGYTQKKMDMQRIFNGQLSRLVETSGSSAGDIPMVEPERIPAGPMQDAWANRHVDRPAYLPINPLIDPGTGQIIKSDVSTLPSPQPPATAVGLLQITGQLLNDENQNVDEVKANVSADAMDIAAQRVDEKSAIYLDNGRQSVQRGGEIYLSKARETYIQADRKMETLSIDGESGTATLMEPFMDRGQVFKIRNDLTAGRYKVIADVTEATTTKRGKAAKQSLEAATLFASIGNNDLATACGLNAIANWDGEDSQKLRDYAHNKAVAIGLDKPTPEEQQELAQAQQNQKPDPATTALEAQAALSSAKAETEKANQLQKLADAHLKEQQAAALGGPESAPEVPSGLDQAHSAADVVQKVAGAKLHEAQAEKIRHDIVQGHRQTILKGHELALKQRQQDHVESQPRGDA